VLSIAAGLVLLAAVPAVGQSPQREKSSNPKASPSKGWRASDLIGSRVSFRDGEASGMVVDLVFNDDGGLESVVVLSKGDRVTVPWREVRPIARQRQERTMSTMPRSRLMRTTPRTERRAEIEREAPEPAYQAPQTMTVLQPRRVILEPRSGDVLDDYLYYRFGYRTTPGWRPADLLKDRYEARHAPPLRPWPRPTYVDVPVHSSVR
jgi:hypothetical protein